jgi:SAM-dependent methyltransferase
MNRKLIKNGYDYIANEYYSKKHITSNNFEDTTFDFFSKSDFIEKIIAGTEICLELGSGKGNTYSYLKIPSSKIVLSDISIPMISNAISGTYFLKVITDAKATPFLDRSFDLITAFLFDPFNDSGLYNEVYRLLTDKGIFIGTLPHKSWGMTLRNELKIPQNKTHFLLSNGEILETNSVLSDKEDLMNNLQDRFEIVLIKDLFLPSSIKTISEHIKIPAKCLNISVYNLPIVQLLILKKK